MKFHRKQSGFASAAGMIITGICVIASIIITVLMFGTNDNGYRTIVKYPSGTTKVVLDADWYLTWFGTENVYNDVITVDFVEGENPARPTVDVENIPVRYQDGGKGDIEGIVRFDLPDTPEAMLKIHKEFGSNRGLATKLLLPLAQEMAQSTAGLMESEEAYAEKRNDYAEWTRSQMAGGKFMTQPKQIVVEDVTGKRVTKVVPVIKYGEDGLPMQSSSDLSHYAINVSGLQIIEWDFEDKTLEQINKKREATMGIIIAIADAEKAVQDAITAEEQGKAKVMTAKYEQEVLKEKAVVVAQREKEVAVIAATRKVEVAEQGKLEAEQKKFAAVEYKQEQILRGEGDGEYKRLVMQADGALKQKLEAWVQVNAKYAQEFGKQKWVPEVQMGSSEGRTGSSAEDLISLLTTRSAQDVALDMKIKAQKQ